jgi:hypothetical protein
MCQTIDYTGSDSSFNDNPAAESIVATYADGYDRGKEKGKNDSKSGNAHNSKCLPNDSLSWCADNTTHDRFF